MTTELLNVEQLRTHFFTEKGTVTAVDDVSFTIHEGEIVGLVGESGCGKSVTSQSIMRLYDEYMVEYEGKIEFNGDNLLNYPIKKMQKIRGDAISMIFQDPLSSLNPVFTIGKQIAEPLMLHHKKSKKEAYERAVELLALTGIPSPEKRVHEYPHQLSGGMRQRAMIAVTLACEPKLLIADEPTTALDVTIQAQILNLMRDLNKKLQMGIIFITHDLGVVAELCDRVMVMYLGQIVEEADVKTLFEKPLHPYTRGLIKSIPQMTGERKLELSVIKGNVPSLTNKPKGCRFSTRCEFADEKCLEEMPPLKTHSDTKKVRCWHYEEIIAREEGGHVHASST
ncbi:ABC transporter ATP-binding protein [Geomicrobium sediminis]|uniref:Oligopeptide/dipeptide ABC transporter ATP-binding protein n=1 Tax=Geomicrobium sediminis TaxID=1347788 RepID=A0ABS2PH34_9BACL|nr:ABC transporter ATP-binding protein [Geomicrobium sediminis]MBM7634747.1 oligopeptide/dipeptide ABC transporter ATP-binding protein [Geomicrobium sediminis]